MCAARVLSAIFWAMPLAGTTEGQSAPPHITNIASARLHEQAELGGSSYRA